MKVLAIGDLVGNAGIKKMKKEIEQFQYNFMLMKMKIEKY